MADLLDRLKVKPALCEGEKINHLLHRLGVERVEAAKVIEDQAAEIEQLRKDRDDWKYVAERAIEECEAHSVDLERARAEIERLRDLLRGNGWSEDELATTQAEAAAYARGVADVRTSITPQEAAMVLLRGGSYEVFGPAFSAMDTRMEESPEAAFSAALRVIAEGGE